MKCKHGNNMMGCNDCFYETSPLVPKQTANVEPDLPAMGYLPPKARRDDPETSREAAATKDDRWLWTAALKFVEQNGPSTEETILLGIGLEQRSSGSSTISQMVKAGQLVNIIDPVTHKKQRGVNTTGRTALLRGLPSQQPKLEIPNPAAEYQRRMAEVEEL